MTESCLLITNQYQNSSIYTLDRFVKKTKVTNGWLPIRGLLIRFFQKNENHHILICVRCLKMFWNDVCNVDAQSTSKHVYLLPIAEMTQFHFQKFWMAIHFETITHNLIVFHYQLRLQRAFDTLTIQNIWNDRNRTDKP